MVMRSGDGRSGSGLVTRALIFRMVWMGVKMNPQGMPHQPTRREPMRERSWCFRPQDRHETRGLLDHRVRTRMDQTK
jgi:hypothetical protein